MFTYSPQLIEETIKTFQEEDGVVLSEEEAVAALEGLGGLFLAFSDKAAAAWGPAGAQAAAIAISENVF